MYIHLGDSNLTFIEFFERFLDSELFNNAEYILRIDQHYHDLNDSIEYENEYIGLVKNRCFSSPLHEKLFNLHVYRVIISQDIIDIELWRKPKDFDEKDLL